MAVPKNAQASSVEIIDPMQGDVVPADVGGDVGGAAEGEGASAEAPPKELPESREAGTPEESPAADPEDPVELEAWFASVPKDAQAEVIAYIKGLRGKTIELEDRASRLHDTLLSDKPDYSALLEESGAEYAAKLEALQQEVEALRSSPDLKPDLERALSQLGMAIAEIAEAEDERASWAEKESGWKTRESDYTSQLDEAKKHLSDYDSNFEELLRFALHGYAPELAMDDSAPEEFVRELIDAAKSMSSPMDIPTKMGAYGKVAKRLAERRGMKASLPPQFVLGAPSVPDAPDRSGNEPLADFYSDPKKGEGYKRLAERLKMIGVG